MSEKYKIMWGEFLRGMLRETDVEFMVNTLFYIDIRPPKPEKKPAESTE